LTLLEHVNDKVGLNKRKPLVVAGIPAFNEERTIAKLVLEAQKYVDVVLVCDDGSTDSTAEIAERMGAEVIRHKQNKGYGASTKSLFIMARELDADVLVTFDGDGQHDPNDIPRLIEPILENRADVVLGSRFLNGQKNGVPGYRSLGIKIISRMTGTASNHNLHDAQCGFRVYGRKAISELNLLENGMGASVEVVMKAKKQGLTVTEVSTECKYEDLERTSTQNPLRHATSIFMSIFRLIVEERPLLLLGGPGLIFLFSGIAFGIWMLKLFVEEQRIVTNIALASFGFIIIGMFTLFTAITLYAISRQAQKNGN